MAMMNNEANNLKVLMKLKVFVKRLQRGMSKTQLLEEEGEEGKVKKGHFTVIAGKGEEAKRFVLELEYLSDPAFIKLLEQAEEEYGFQQQGVLEVPCRPQELQTILGDRRSRRRMSTEW